MKKLINPMLLIAALLFVAPVGVLVTGCQSTASQTHNTVKAIDDTVDAALTAWANHVVSEEKRIAALPDQADRDTQTAALLAKRAKVSAALNLYTEAALSIESGVISGTADKTASSKAVAAASQFTNLTQSLSK